MTTEPAESKSLLERIKAVMAKKTDSRVRMDAQKDRMFLILAEGIELELVRVAAGPFLMGSDQAADPAASVLETPQHQVVLDEYWIGRYPVTNLQYGVFLEAKKRQPPKHWPGSYPQGIEDHPMRRIKKKDAVGFCHWLSALVKVEISLPSEAQWEKAARGTDGRLYPWGNETPDASRCNTSEGLIRTTTPVGKFSPQGDSPYGCADMAGNVMEWVDDGYKREYYAQSPLNNPSGPGDALTWLLRGGSYVYSAKSARCAYRHLCLDERSDDDDFGFRVSARPLTG
ncbi:MAG TPA: SUMF1/EgtB/PvdO family nonheme iron enzyme [Anaerolineaceae bacterium]|nr:SUMF1/EgtB/PvdO family nonheme iron enzyme [Anaerolineaceae bacterium]HPN53755.1 SUMF1/EgtB/PvdO family nonheme iron enzyme [Anaerolineaceae bacterium]